MDGFYVGYFTGDAGNGLAMFIFLNGVIVGVDAGGVRFDGTYQSQGEGFKMAVTITAPPGGMLIQGVATGESGLTYQVERLVPADLETLDYLTFPTPYGPVNARFKKLRDV